MTLSNTSRKTRERLSQSPRITSIIDGIIDIEGGYVNDPDDPGGPTKYGITEAVARRHGYTGAMSDLPRKLAESIYRQTYIERPNFDEVFELSEPIAEEMIDTGVNAGMDLPAKSLQRGLNAFNNRQKLYADIKADGLVGDKTLAALESYLKHRGSEGERVMVKLLDSAQGTYYLGLAESSERYEKYIYGWFVDRIGNVEFV